MLQQTLQQNGSFEQQFSKLVLFRKSEALMRIKSIIVFDLEVPWNTEIIILTHLVPSLKNLKVFISLRTIVLF